jgi:hypothetical protein
MSRIIIVVCLFVMLFVAVSPAFAGGPRGGHGNNVRGYVRRSVAGWQTAGRSVVAAGRWAGSHVRFGDQMNIGAAIQGAANQAQGKH